jgi:hypothetical protein
MADSPVTDEFDMDEPPPAVTPTPHDADRVAYTAPAAAKGKGVGAKAKEGWWRDWYAIAAVAAIGVVWLFWPSSPQSGRSPPPQQQSDVLDPQSAMQEAAQQPVQQAPALPARGAQAPQPTSPAKQAGSMADARPATATSTNEPEQATAAVAQEAKSSTGTDSTSGSPARASSTAAAPTEPRAPEDAIEDRLKKYEAHLNDVRVGLRQTQDRLDELSKRIETKGTASAPEKALTKRAAASADRTAKGETKPREPSVVRALNGEPYVINTIGRGIAFIQAGDHLEVVTPGDRVSGVRIIAIDPAAHLITTSNGVIR